MHKVLKLFCVSVMGIGAILAANAAEAPGRAAANMAPGRASMVQRMPTMPTMPINTTGNLSPNLPTDSKSGPVPPCPGGFQRCPDGQCPDSKGVCPCPGGLPRCPDGSCPDAKGNCPTPSKCPDGGVENSDYTVENCMNEVLACVNNGALPNGLNDMFNYDLRYAIENGMGLCTLQVEKCISTVRKNCAYVYRVSSDVWLDFNSRKVQPEYYSFILRKTGLTPNQAENTCWLLDKNTYGASFDAVANSGVTTSEYNNRVGAYNSQAGGIGKANPQGVTVNNNNPGVDGQRGHYARWDATTGECLIRVAAYNKDTHIKNSWLFGALGDDKPAEVWKAAGDTFSCNKDMFGFSLLNDTSTVAVVGVGGGTAVGAGIGALAGHGKRDFNCGDQGHREELSKQLRNSGNVIIINEYLENYQVPTSGTMDAETCNEIVDLYNKYNLAMTYKDTNCDTASAYKITVTTEEETRYVVSGGTSMTKAEIEAAIKELNAKENKTPAETTELNALMAQVQNATQTELNKGTCKEFHSLKKTPLADFGPCDRPGGGCIPGPEFVKQRTTLGNVINAVPILKDGEKSNMLKSTLIGAGTGAAAGGLATAITSFVEKNNINCRVGDGLERVGYNKSHSISTLKDFYVKWNLRLPDTVMPTPSVVDCTTWKAACATLTDLNQCAAAQINYKPAKSNATILIPGACKVSGSACLENHAVAVSFGACPK